MSASFTLEGLLPGVNYEMSLKNGFEGETFMANTAEEVEFTRMIRNMILPGDFEVEAFATVSAEKRFLGGFNLFSMGYPHMIIQARSGAKCFPTICTHKRFSSFVFFVLRFMIFREVLKQFFNLRCFVNNNQRIAKFTVENCAILCIIITSVKM